MTKETNVRREVAQFQASILCKSRCQLTIWFGGCLATLARMNAVIDVYYWMARGFATLAAGFLVRVFMIQHDCGHLSLFRARSANDIIGIACSQLICILAPNDFDLGPRHSGGNRDRRR